MSTSPQVATVGDRPRALPSLRDLLDLTKARLASLVLVTVAFGFLLAGGGGSLVLLAALLGVGLVAGAASIFNQVLERDTDRIMNRTSDRPLPAGRVDVGDALLLGLGAAACGLTLLVVLVNGLTALLSLTSLVLYVVVYTPLKQKTSFHTLIGAVTGALPPVMGWAAATGQAPREAWILFGILFVWQLPHFFAIAWLYREDYARAGMRMLSVMDEGGKMAIRQVLLFSLTLLPVSLLPSTVAMAGEVYLFAALLLGTALVAAALTLIRRPDARRARNVYLMSLVYLPCLLGVMVLDRWTLA